MALRLCQILIRLLLALAVVVLLGRIDPGEARGEGNRSGPTRSVDAPATSPTLAAFDAEEFGRQFPELAAGAFTPAEPGHAATEVMFDAEDGRLDHYSPLTAALWLGGVTSEEVRRTCEARFDVFLGELRRQPVSGDDPAALAWLIHEHLHRRLLTGEYEVAASNLEGALTGGAYNCVSAALLYYEASRQLGLHCEIVAWPDHVACRVATSHGSLAVEPTCVTWFERARRGTQAPTAPRTTPPRCLTEVQFLALVDYNRGVALLREGRHQAAMQANLRALRLDPRNVSARNNLLAAINNEALALSRDRQFGAALELLARGRRLAPDYAPFVINTRHVEQQSQATSG
ncbi:MAG: hypothetical protein DWQ31_20710 [Planctomycetota bacterium]|nr:MAG: hypothetical protein DWQ31_20710 [Planctomycetota bacterium]REJ96711.1 MAG: hypothetical protein DWQ35_03840 [Planctomycetota bacterium]REK22312.1 MAG: hypothetical protein DWQ42_17380 [Planctomycetota bacterium]REK41061.1 MAG: hypothetical protein DWQ46_14555 [Planctomycetota bacterium]